ncbi:MAG: peptidylprolyl isomerase [Bryobacteraceae bacterium]|nr:peptidylprolyl isomerase [Bryobacterales bacterium]MEB2361307.1 peptidylprolyl isomerase [Bryobacterales bacterium]NUN02536.1 peptidylprolyl isomerase [Bryobacteraceae bacterium]
MFDLFRRRDKAVRYLLTALLVVVALSMVTYLIPGSGMMGGPDDPIVAEIGDEALTVHEVQRTLQTAMRSQQIPSQLVDVYVPEMINQMINERAVAYEARRMGFRVTEEELAKAIQSTMPQLFENGQFVGRDAYAAVLAQQNLSIPQFEDNFRKQLLMLKLQNLVLEGVIVTPEEVEKAFRQRNEKVKVSYIVLNPEKLRSQVTVTPAEIADYYEKNKPAFQIPEKRSFDLIVIDEAQVAQSFTINDEELRKLYEQNQERYRVPERVRARHILLKTTDKPKDEIPAIRAKAESLLKQIQSGGDFAKLAREYSEDPGSATKGGELGWITRGQTVKNFEQSAFSLKPGQVSGIIETEYGFHIIQVEEKEEPHVRPFSEVKSELAAESKRQQTYDKMQTIADEVHAALIRSPEEGRQLAQKYGVPVTHVSDTDLSKPIEGIGNNPDFQEAIRSLQIGQVTPIAQPAANKLAMAVLTGIKPSRQAELGEVESEIRETVLQQKAMELARKRAAEAEEKIQAAGGDLRKVARSMGLEVKTTPDFTRDAAAEGIGPASYLAEAFEKEVGAVLPPVTVDNQVFIVKVAGKTPADLTQLASQREDLVSSIRTAKARQRDELFKDGLLTQLIKDGKVKIHDAAVKRLIASYRS